MKKYTVERKKRKRQRKLRRNRKEVKVIRVWPVEEGECPLKLVKDVKH